MAWLFLAGLYALAGLWVYVELRSDNQIKVDAALAAATWPVAAVLAIWEHFES